MLIAINQSLVFMHRLGKTSAIVFFVDELKVVFQIHVYIIQYHTYIYTYIYIDIRNMGA